MIDLLSWVLVCLHCFLSFEVFLNLFRFIWKAERDHSSADSHCQCCEQSCRGQVKPGAKNSAWSRVWVAGTLTRHLLPRRVCRGQSCCLNPCTLVLGVKWCLNHCPKFLPFSTFLNHLHVIPNCVLYHHWSYFIIPFPSPPIFLKLVCFPVCISA